MTYGYLQIADESSNHDIKRDLCASCTTAIDAVFDRLLRDVERNAIRTQDFEILRHLEALRGFRTHTLKPDFALFAFLIRMVSLSKVSMAQVVS